MKKILIVFLLLTIVASCTKDDNDKLIDQTFTGLNNDTVWLYKEDDFEVSHIDDIIESQSYYFRFIDNELIFASIRSRFSQTSDEYNKCEKEIDVLSDGIDENMTFEVNTPEILIMVLQGENDDFGKYFSAAKLEVIPGNNNLFRYYEVEGEGEFNLDEVEFEPVTTVYNSFGVLGYKISWVFEKVDLDWDELLIDCDDNIDI